MKSVRQLALLSGAVAARKLSSEATVNTQANTQATTEANAEISSELSAELAAEDS
jgi:hypothetical protein